MIESPVPSTQEDPFKSLPEDAICIECGYALVGLTQPRCPECGKGFTPDDAKTYQRAGLIAKTDAWWQEGPGWFIASGALLTALLLLWGWSVPGGFIVQRLFGTIGILVISLAWLSRMLPALVLLWASVRFKEVCAKRWKGWLAPLVIGLLTSVLLEVEAIPRLRFELARPGMEAMAGQIQPGQPPQAAQIGGTQFSTIEPCGNSGMVFLIRGTQFIYFQHGWAYLPDPADQADALAGVFPSKTFTPYTGDWYHVMQTYP